MLPETRKVLKKLLTTERYGREWILGPNSVSINKGIGDITYTFICDNLGRFEVRRSSNLVRDVVIVVDSTTEAPTDPLRLHQYRSDQALVKSLFRKAQTEMLENYKTDTAKMLDSTWF